MPRKAPGPSRARKAKPAPKSAQGTSSFPPSLALTRSHYQREYERRYERAKDNIDLTDRLKELRRYVKGFDPNRYNLRHIDTWSDSNREHVRESSKRLRSLIASPHISVPVPRDKKKRRALKTFTSQDPREMRRFILHTEAPETTSLEFTPRGRVQLRVKSGPKTSFTREFFFWRDYTKRVPVTLSAQRRVLEKMLNTGVLPPGKYAFWSERHGMTGVPQDRDFLLEKLNEWYYAYEQGEFAYLHEGFGRVLTGLIYLGGWRNMRAAQVRAAKERNRYQVFRQFRITERKKKVRRKDATIRKQIVKQAMRKRPVKKKVRKHK